MAYSYILNNRAANSSKMFEHPLNYMALYPGDGNLHLTTEILNLYLAISCEIGTIH
jgi:hypothetical protein